MTLLFIKACFDFKLLFCDHPSKFRNGLLNSVQADPESNPLTPHSSYLRFQDAFHSQIAMLCKISKYHSNFSLQSDQIEKYVPRYLVYALIWSFAGDGKLKVREEMGSHIRNITTIPLPSSSASPIVDFEVRKNPLSLQNK